MFKLLYDTHITYCSVKEFSADHGMCYIPRWVTAGHCIHCR